MNWIVLLLSALIPLALGFVWYNPKFGFGNAWMKSAGVTNEEVESGNMPLIFGLAFLFAFLAALMLHGIVIHQDAIHSLLFAVTDADVSKMGNDFLAAVENNHRTFGHGVLHGIFAGLLLVTPIMATNALFERKGFKYIAINCGYWIVALALMGGVICQYG